MSKSFDGATSGKSKLGKSKSWADVGDDDFFAAVAQDKPAKTSPTASWGARTEKPAEKKTGGVPWSFPNPVQQTSGQASQGSPASPAGGDRFGCFSPNQRRSAPLSAWRRN